MGLIRWAWRNRGVLWAVAVLACVGLIVGRQVGETARVDGKVDQVVAGGCLFWGDLAGLATSYKTTPPTVSALGLRIFADSWPAYDTHRCPARYGPLPPPPAWLRPAVGDAYRRAALKQAHQGPAD